MQFQILALSLAVAFAAASPVTQDENGEIAFKREDALMPPPPECDDDGDKASAWADCTHEYEAMCTPVIGNTYAKWLVNTMMFSCLSVPSANSLKFDLLPADLCRGLDFG